MQCKECGSTMTLEEFQAHEKHVQFLYECECGETQELKDHTRNINSLSRKAILELTENSSCKHNWEEFETPHSFWLLCLQCSKCNKRRFAAKERT